MFVQFLVFPPVARRYGVLNCLRGCTMVFPIAYFFTPFTVLLPTPITQQIAVLSVILIKCCAGVFAFPCVTILLTNSARSLRLLGTLNGVATSLSAIGRAAGPAIAGGAFTFGIDTGYVIVPWWTLAIFAVIGNVPVWWLQEMNGFGDTEESASADEEEEEDNLPEVSGDRASGATSSSVQTTGIHNPVGVIGSNHSQKEDDLAIDEGDFGEDSLLTRTDMGAKNLGRDTHLRF